MHTDSTPSTARLVHLVSLGCPKNRVDAEVMLARLETQGFRVTDQPEKAGLLVVNTCGFIRSAVEEAIAEILALAGLKEDDPAKRLVVTGCMVQRYGKKLRRELPEVDLFVGTDGFQDLDHLLAAMDKPGGDLHLVRPAFVMASDTGRRLSTPAGTAYLKVTEGCNNRCSYCLIPSLRGRLRSRSVADLVLEARDLEKKGVKELILVAQDLTAYGDDLADGSDLGLLLRSLLDCTGIPWLRLLYLYPSRLSQGLLEIIAGQRRILPYFDLPFQHVADRVLAEMGRPYGQADIRALLEKIRGLLPQAVIRATFMTGFPGESPEDVQKLADFLQEQGLDHVGIFAYENEEGSRSARMAGQIAAGEKKRRRGKLMRLQGKISRERLKVWRGKELEVLVEGLSRESDLLLEGRAWFQAPEIDGCVYISAGEAEAGQIVRLRVTETHDYDLVGEIVTAPDHPDI